MATASALAQTEKWSGHSGAPNGRNGLSHFSYSRCLVCAEVLLRMVATVNPGIPVNQEWKPSSTDLFATHEQFSEGFALSHFARDGGRLTGNPPISGAPTIVLLGDSYVERLS